MCIDDIKTIDDVLNDLDYELNEPKSKVDDVIGFNNFGDAFNDIIDTLHKNGGPIIVRTGVQESLANHDWYKYVYENEKIKAVYHLDPIANLEYLKEVLEGCDSVADNIRVVLRHRKERFGWIDVSYDQLDVWME